MAQKERADGRKRGGLGAAQFGTYRKPSHVGLREMALRKLDRALPESPQLLLAQAILLEYDDLQPTMGDAAGSGGMPDGGLGGAVRGGESGRLICMRSHLEVRGLLQPRQFEPLSQRNQMGASATNEAQSVACTWFQSTESSLDATVVDLYCFLP